MSGRITALETILSCPVCQVRMQPPIFVCRKGHVICMDCKYNFEQCHECKSDYTLSNDDIFDSILLETSLHCQYQHLGCKAKMELQHLVTHEQHLCDFRPVVCALSNVKHRSGHCLNEINISNYKDHIKNTHSYSEKNAITLGKDKNVFVQLKHNVPIRNYFVDSENDAYFIETILYNQEMQRVAMKYQYVGPKAQADNFKFTINLCNVSNEKHKSEVLSQHCSAIGRSGRFDRGERTVFLESNTLQHAMSEQGILFYSIKFVPHQRKPEHHPIPKRKRPTTRGKKEECIVM